MFTGLIDEVGIVGLVEAGPDGTRLGIDADLSEYVAPGGSVSVNGVCLTALSPSFASFVTDVMNQTLAVTALDRLEVDSPVNLELALKATDRLAGHIVQGHVDGVGEVISSEPDGFAERLRVGLAPELLRYAVEKGSIALDGVSLTIAALGEDWIEVSLIPETLERTNLGEAKAGRKLNVECDVVAKYVERLVSPLARKEQT